MPLSEKDRVERQVLGFLNFHERSPVRLAVDPEACERFGCPDPVFLGTTLSDMQARDLFRVLPSPVRAVDALGPPSFPGQPGPGEAEERGPARARFDSGVSVMITSEGKRRYGELRSKTTQVRQADWQEERGPLEPGEWTRSDAGPP